MCNRKHTLTMKVENYISNMCVKLKETETSEIHYKQNIGLPLPVKKGQVSNVVKVSKT